MKKEVKNEYDERLRVAAEDVSRKRLLWEEIREEKKALQKEIDDLRGQKSDLPTAEALSENAKEQVGKGAEKFTGFTANPFTSARSDLIDFLKKYERKACKAARTLEDDIDLEDFSAAPPEAVPQVRGAIEEHVRPHISTLENTAFISPFLKNRWKRRAKKASRDVRRDARSKMKEIAKEAIREEKMRFDARIDEKQSDISDTEQQQADRKQHLEEKKEQKEALKEERAQHLQSIQEDINNWKTLRAHFGRAYEREVAERRREMAATSSDARRVALLCYLEAVRKEQRALMQAY